jgi:exodeoxyribonuclease V alpha subunit
MEEEIFGYIESIVFAESEKGFTVARLKEPKKTELTTLIGCMPSVQPGETVLCKGVWKHHPQHGRQFEVSHIDFHAPSDLIGIQKYLESGMIKGIGSAYAERIVKQFGLETLDIIDQTPDRLFEVPGIGPKRVQKILSCWQQQRAIREVMIFLRSHGVSPSFAQKIFKAYGEKSIEKVKENPYALAKEIFGIGFKTADQVAQKLGFPVHSSLRIDAGIEHVLWELTNEGHVCFPEKELIPQAREMLGANLDQITLRMEELVRSGQLIRENEKIWVKPLYLSELGIAREINRISSSLAFLRSVDQEKALQWVQNQLKLKLALEQKIAVAHGVAKKFLLITGGPGTGKSTITKAILAITEKLTSKIILAAPTGRAAKRMSEITGKKAFTIHSLLEMDFQAGGFKHNRDHPLDCDLIIIDETSMVDTSLMHHLLKAIPSHSRVILIGDIDQLPSVGPGNVLKDLILSKRLLVCELKQIFRQAAGSDIVMNAHLVNQGLFPNLKGGPKRDFFFLSSDTPESIADTIVMLVKQRLPHKYRFHRFDDIQVLSPMKRGVIGTEHLNLLLQKELNPRPSSFQRMGRSFQLGDKVMQIRNNYQKQVYNGDVGKIMQIDESEEVVSVLFEDRTVVYDFSEVDELVLAYAVSIHKYQGSECPCIIIPIHMSHFKLLFRNLLYTGITRGKNLVILVGSKKALAIAIKNNDSTQRHTGLVSALCQLLPENFSS